MLDRLTVERLAATSGLRPIIVALSGGGDSVALMHMLAEAVNPRALYAVVIDHALREGSQDDAARAASFAEDLNLCVEVVRLRWDAGSNRAQQSARAARYTALCETARRVGARVIVTGHTRDDQAETVLLRAERGSGWRGLAGMRAFAPAPIWPEGRGLWLARPLLGARRADLRAHLQERGAAWIDDPANTNDAYARVRARKTLAALEAANFDPMRLAALAERLAPRAEALDAEAAALIESAAAFREDTILVARARWRGGEVGHHALGALLTAAGGAERVPNDESVSSLLERMQAEAFAGATLGGAQIAPTKEGWRLTRDPGGLSGRADGAAPAAALPLPTDRDAVWDRRLQISSSEPDWSVVVEKGAPVLARAERRRAISEARSRWLVRERVRHLLGMLDSRMA